MVISETEYLFVYGTLMKQYRENPFLETLTNYATFLSTAFTTGKLFLVDFYPGMVESDTFEFVYGEKYKIHDAKALFEILDAYEDYDPFDVERSLFVRKKVLIYENVKSPAVWAWTYIFNRQTALLRKIESGNFMDFVSENR